MAFNKQSNQFVHQQYFICDSHQQVGVMVESAGRNYVYYHRGTVYSANLVSAMYLDSKVRMFGNTPASI